MENIFYYCFLFLLVICIRFFKLKKDYKEQLSKKWYEVTYSSLEIVYTASGLVIALILNVPKEWIASVVIGYVLILIFSALLEMSDAYFGNRSKSILHSIIIFIVITSTIISYTIVIPSVDINGHPTESSNSNKEKQYTLIIPYTDQSLIRHVGYNKIKDKPFKFEITILSNSPDSALLIAKCKIKNEKLITSIYPTNDTCDIQLIEDKIIIIETKELNKFYAN